MAMFRRTFARLMAPSAEQGPDPAVPLPGSASAPAGHSRAFAPAEVRTGPSALPARTRGRWTAEGAFRTDRAAARYAPADAVLRTGSGDVPVVSVSLSGIAVNWQAPPFPTIDSVVTGDLVPTPTAMPFEAPFRVIRVDRTGGLIAGRFEPLPGLSIDGLLAWLVQLDRLARRQEGPPRERALAGA